MTHAVSSCPSCSAVLPGDAGFCPRCGAAIAGGKRRSRRVPAFLVASGAVGAVMLALGLVVWRGQAMPRAPETRFAQSAGTSEAPGAIPDISNLTPKERFNRLYGRLIQALRAGDTATFSRLAPMALAAYAMLDSTDLDSLARHRAEVLRLHSSDTVPTVRTSVAP